MEVLLYSLRVHEMHPWEYNEYEGQIDGELNGVAVCCYVVVTSSAEWTKYPPGTVLQIEAWIERTGEVELVEPGTPLALQQVKNVEYDVTGRIIDIDRENLRLESLLPIRVDLDPSSHSRSKIPSLEKNGTVRVRGTLKVDLYPDQE